MSKKLIITDIQILKAYYDPTETDRNEVVISPAELAYQLKIGVSGSGDFSEILKAGTIDDGAVLLDLLNGKLEISGK